VIFEILAAVKISVFFWVVMPYRLVDRDTNVLEEHTASIFKAETLVSTYMSTQHHNTEQHWHLSLCIFSDRHFEILPLHSRESANH
jgi:hypothetical protein